MKTLSRQTVGKSAAPKSRLRRKAVARNLALGMTSEQAVVKAGYSPTTVVDHTTRMAAAAHLTGLYRAKGNEVQEDDAGSKGPLVVYQINFIESSKDAKPVMVNRPISQSSPAVAQVSFINGKR
jgi:hypothetical protein